MLSITKKKKQLIVGPLFVKIYQHVFVMKLLADRVMVKNFMTVDDPF